MAIIQNPIGGYYGAALLCIMGVVVLVIGAGVNNGVPDNMKMDTSIFAYFAILCFILAAVSLFSAIYMSERLDNAGVHAEDRSVFDQQYVIPVGVIESDSEISIAARLERLAKLRREGVITEDDYQRRKEEILSEV